MVLFQEKFLMCSDLDERCDLALTLIPSEVVNRQKLDKQALVALHNRSKATLNYEFCHEKIRSKAYLFKAKYPIVTKTKITICRWFSSIPYKLPRSMAIMLPY
jgi:hypothetical protein